MKKHLIVLLLSGIAITGMAQSATPVMPQTSIKAAYLGSLVYPGFKLGIERPYKVKQVEKNKKKGKKVILKERYLTANLGYYHHETFHDNFYLLVERQKRRQNARGCFWEIAPGIGFSRTFLGGTSYQVSDDGNVSIKRLTGYNYALISCAFGGGYNFATKKNKPIKIYGKTSILGLFPSNSTIDFRPTAEIGVVYSLPGFLKANPTIKIKQK